MSSPSPVTSIRRSDSRSRTSISGYRSLNAGTNGAISRLPIPSGAATWIDPRGFFETSATAASASSIVSRIFCAPL